MFSVFMINTWVVATIIAVVCGMVGFFVVIRGASFAAHALPLGAFPGAAAANLLGIDPMIGLMVFAELGAIAIGRLSRRARPDVGTALCLVALLGTGALFLSMTHAYSQQVYGLLFGEVLGVSRQDIALVSVVGALAVGSIITLFHPFLLSSLSLDLGEVQGISGHWIDLAFLSILALASAMALPVVGALLVFSLLIGPPAAARAFSPCPVVSLAWSVALSLLCVWLSIALSYLSDWPVGFFVGVLCAVCYAVGRIGVQRLGRQGQTDPSLSQGSAS